jgi:hypothetical protein
MIFCSIFYSKALVILFVYGHSDGKPLHTVDLLGEPPSYFSVHDPLSQRIINVLLIKADVATLAS